LRDLIARRLSAMCGIVAVVRRPGARSTPDLRSLIDALDGVEATLQPLVARPDTAALHDVAQHLAHVDRALRGAGGTVALLADPVAFAPLEPRGAGVSPLVAELAAALDSDAAAASDLEALNAAVVACKDAAWSLERDRLGTARAVERLGGGTPREP